MAQNTGIFRKHCCDNHLKFHTQLFISSTLQTSTGLCSYKIHIAIAMKKPKANVSKTVVSNKSHMDPNVVCYKKKYVNGDGKNALHWDS
jgi:hypothetical protein